MKYETLADISARMSVPMSTLHYYIRAFGQHLGELRRGRSNTIMFNPRQVTMFETIIRLRQEGMAMSEINERLTTGNLEYSSMSEVLRCKNHETFCQCSQKNDGKYGYERSLEQLVREVAGTLGKLLVMCENITTELDTIKKYVSSGAGIEGANHSSIALYSPAAAGVMTKARNILSSRAGEFTSNNSSEEKKAA